MITDSNAVISQDVSEKDMRDAFFDHLYELAAKDKNVVFLTADMGANSLERFRNDLGSQYINVGIAEQNLVSIASGLALGGKKVFIYAIASFITRRCYEQIKIDICGMRLPVTIIGSGPGISYSSDGPTHHATDDIAIMRNMPYINILNPSDSVLSESAAGFAYESNEPIYIRLDKGMLPELYNRDITFNDGLSELKEGQDLTIVSTGIMVHKAFEIAEDLARLNIDAAIVDVYRIKPLNEEMMTNIIRRSKWIITIEEHSITGGLGSAVCELMADKGISKPVKRFGIRHICTAGYGDRDWMHAIHGLDTNTIVREVLEWKGIRCVSSGTNLTNTDLTWLKMTAEKFANSFGSVSDDIPDECLKMINEMDFRYRKLNHDERDQVLLDVIRKIDSKNLTVSGKERRNDWEMGWSENFQDFIDKGYNTDELVPRYYKPGFYAKRILRFDKDYIEPIESAFEINWFSVFRHWLFMKYLNSVDCVYEFGCGTGHNLTALAKLYPAKKLYGLDWAASSQKILDNVKRSYGYNITADMFDMFNPEEKLNIADNSAVMTIGSMEQLGANYDVFLNFILKKSPALCLHIEPTMELYDNGNLLDYLAIKYHRMRGYQETLLSRLKQLEAEGTIEIIRTKRTLFGSLYQEGYTYTVWRKIKTSEHKGI